MHLGKGIEMPRDKRTDDDSRNLDIFEDLADDSRDAPPTTSRSIEERTNVPDAVADTAGKEKSGSDIFAEDNDLDLGSDLDAQASQPDPTLNLPDSAADDEDELDYAGPDESINFATNDPTTSDDDLEYAGPEPTLNLPGKEDDEESSGEDEPVPSVTQDEGSEPIIFDEEANQGYPADPDDDEPQDDDIDVPLVPVTPGSDTEPSDTPDLPEIGALPEPPYELELAPSPAHDLDLDLDDEDDDMDGD